MRGADDECVTETNRHVEPWYRAAWDWPRSPRPPNPGWEEWTRCESWSLAKERATRETGNAPEEPRVAYGREG